MTEYDIIIYGLCFLIGFLLGDKARAYFDRKRGKTP